MAVANRNDVMRVPLRITYFVGGGGGAQRMITMLLTRFGSRYRAHRRRLGDGGI